MKKEKTLHRLKDSQIKKLCKGRYHDGGGLYLNVTANLTKSFVFVWTRDKKRQEMGLGRLRFSNEARESLGNTLVEARELAAAYRKTIVEGGDPRRNKQEPEAPTAHLFGDVALEYIARNKSGWRNAKHVNQWESTLRTYCVPIWHKDVADVTVSDVEKILLPIWETKAETASRVRGRLEKVLSFAITKEWRERFNPAVWRGNLENLLRKREKLQKGHRKAMPYSDIPAFYNRLKEASGRDSVALRFVILNVSRSGEVRLATWGEIDFEKKLWTIPPERLKAPIKLKDKLLPHIVPLSNEAIAILQMKLLNDDEPMPDKLIFEGSRKDRPLSDMTLTALMRRWNIDYHVHGFRSCFATWAEEETDASFEVIETALAHKVGNAVSQAYRRGSMIEKRRGLMDEWAGYLTSSG